MATKILGHPFSQLTFTALIGLSLLVCLFPQLVPSLSWISNHAVPFMLFYLLAGLVFLLLKQPALTFLSFGACVVLCMFLKFSVQNDDIMRWRETVIKRSLPNDRSMNEAKPIFKIAHFNISNVPDVSIAINTMLDINADMLSVHEVTPQWDEWLNDSLRHLYPYHHTLVDIGLYGMAVYSKYAFEKIDTFYYREIPSLTGSVKIDKDHLFFVSVHTEPALNESSHLRLKEHLGGITSILQQVDIPAVVFGDFNAVSWSNEIQVFRQDAGLLESRTGFMPHASGGVTSFFDVPFDHIFYSPNLHCLGFENLMGQIGSSRLGISGTYQFKPLNSYVRKIAR